MRTVKQSTVKQFTSENHHWVLALSCSCSGSGDVQSFIWIPPRAGIIHDSVVWGDHREQHAGCDFLFLLLKRKIHLVSSPTLGWSWDGNSHFFLNKHRPQCALRWSWQLKHTYKMMLLILLNPNKPLRNCKLVRANIDNCFSYAVSYWATLCL